jgi:hypothetical protein
VSKSIGALNRPGKFTEYFRWIAKSFHEKKNFDDTGVAALQRALRKL